jgi:YbgC/YbaW family acyl-CoA thioester hydrolase
MHEYRFQVLEHHLDTFGHVNNATYASLFEEARWDLITRGGYGLKETQENQQGPIILEMNLKFKRELLLREWVTINTHCPDPGAKIVKIHQEMVQESGDVACEAVFTAGFFDMKLRKMIPPTEKWKAAIGD